MYNLSETHLARRVLRVRPLVPQELPRIAKDCVAKGFVSFSQINQVRIQKFRPTPESGERYILPELCAYDSQSPSYVQENNAMLMALDLASHESGKLVTFAVQHNIGGLEAVRVQVELHRLCVTRFVMNRDDVEVWKKGLTTHFRPSPPGDIAQGTHGDFYGATLTTVGENETECVPSGVVYAVTDPEFLGELSLRDDTFGIALPQPKAVAKLIISEMPKHDCNAGL